MEERLLAALDELRTRGTWLAFVGAVALVAGWCWFKVQLGRLRTYHEEKGKNLATKEDVAELTRLAEEVRHEFESLREASSQKNRLQLAALDKRLEAHQRAFDVWHELTGAYLLDEERPMPEEPIVKAARAKFAELWRDYSLYLDSEARQAMFELPVLHEQRLDTIEVCERWDREGMLAIDPPKNDVEALTIDVKRHRDWEARNAAAIAQHKNECKERWDKLVNPIVAKIFETRDVIERGVHLPAIGEGPSSTPVSMSASTSTTKGR